MSESTTTTTRETVAVSDKQWAMYAAVEHDGMSKKAAAEAAGYTSGGGGGAAYDRVAALIKSGAIVTVNGVPMNADGDGNTPVIVDRESVAEDILEGSAPLLAAFDKLDRDRVNLKRTIDRHESAIAEARSEFDTLDGKVSRARDLMAGMGFDWEAFESRTAPTTPDDDGDDAENTEDATA